MKTKPEVKKLIIRKSMLRELEVSRLTQVVGGTLPTSAKCSDQLPK